MSGNTDKKAVPTLVKGKKLPGNKNFRNVLLILVRIALFRDAHGWGEPKYPQSKIY